MSDLRADLRRYFDNAFPKRQQDQWPFSIDDLTNGIMATIDGYFPPVLPPADDTERPDATRDDLLRALWDCGVASGMDTDGDSGPGAMVAGMGVLPFARAMVGAVAELHDNYEELLGADDTERLRRIEAAARAVIAETDEWMEDGIAGDPGPAEIALRKALEAASQDRETP